MDVWTFTQFWLGAAGSYTHLYGSCREPHTFCIWLRESYTLSRGGTRARRYNLMDWSYKLDTNLVREQQRATTFVLYCAKGNRHCVRSSGNRTIMSWSYRKESYAHLWELHTLVWELQLESSTTLRGSRGIQMQGATLVLYVSQAVTHFYMVTLQSESHVLHGRYRNMEHIKGSLQGATHKILGQQGDTPLYWGYKETHALAWEIRGPSKELRTSKGSDRELLVHTLVCSKS